MAGNDERIGIPADNILGIRTRHCRAERSGWQSTLLVLLEESGPRGPPPTMGAGEEATAAKLEDDALAFCSLVVLLVRVGRGGTGRLEDWVFFLSRIRAWRGLASVGPLRQQVHRRAATAVGRASEGKGML